MKIILISLVMFAVIMGDRIGDFLRAAKSLLGDLFWGVLFIMSRDEPEFSGSLWEDD